MTGGPEGLEIVIPATRSLFALGFLGMWLVGWFMGEVAVIARLASAGEIGREPVLILWLLLWTAGGGAAAYTWLWMLAGKERVLMGASTLRVKRDVLGFGPARVFELSKIRNLRVPPQSGVRLEGRTGLRPWGVTSGAITFEYAGKTVRFGVSIEDTEARAIVERMKQRYVFPETSAAS
jgi:hypothetical protein